MRNMQQAARLVLNKFLENGAAEDLRGYKDTLQEIQRQEPGEDIENLLQRIDTALKEREQEG